MELKNHFWTGEEGRREAESTFETRSPREKERFGAVSRELPMVLEEAALRREVGQLR